VSGGAPRSRGPGRIGGRTGSAAPALERGSGPTTVGRPRGAFRCPECGGATAGPTELRDHRAWCQGDALANVSLLEEVLARDGELEHEALVAEARRRAGRPRPNG
jgi:hypothetical protein